MVDERSNAAGDAQQARLAAFLDRDGVINVDTGYSYRPELLELTPTAGEAVRLLNEAGYLVIVVTNQSGVARGYYKLEDVEAYHEALRQELALHGAKIDAFYYCPYHPDGSVAEFARDHEDRKPRPGMLHKAMRDWGCRLDGSFLIGDKQSDADCASAVGLPSMLVRSNDCDLAGAVQAMMSRSKSDP